MATKKAQTEDTKEVKKRGRPKKQTVEKVEAEMVSDGTKKTGVGVNGNLVPFDKLTESQQREIRSAGGKASAKKKRERKAIREFLNDFLDADAVPALAANMQKLGVDPEDMSNYAAMCLSLFSKAVNHADINAFRTLMEYAGRAPLQEMQENAAVAKLSQAMQLAAPNEESEEAEIEDVVFYIPQNNRGVINEEDLVTVE